MMPEHNPKGKVTLEDLFHLKRSEQPPVDFWSDFQRELHERQRAAAIDPKRWWFVLPRVFKGLARYQMPVGAAAVLAVTFLSFRDYREPSFDVIYTAPAASPVAAQPAVANEPATIDLDTVVVEALPSDLAANLSLPSGSRVAERIAEVVQQARPETRAELVNPTPSPSARSIAANLAAVEAEQSHISRMLGEPQLTLGKAGVEMDPLAQLESFDDSRRQRLFEYDPSAAYAANDQDTGVVATAKVANRLNDEVLYDTVRRLSAGGDRLTLKF